MNKYKKDIAIIEEIKLESEGIDSNLIATEVLNWVKDNVINFIDNHAKKFKLDLTIAEPEEGAELSMPETYKLQSLYQRIPDDPESDLSSDEIEKNESLYERLGDEEKEFIGSIQECRKALDIVTSEAFEKMNGHPLLKDLFNEMIFYYEIKGVNKGKLLKSDLTGSVGISLFEYDSFPVNVQVFQKNPTENADGEIEEGEKELVSERVIPEGFSVWLEISYRPVTRSASLF